jgi:hypothetical protein
VRLGALLLTGALALPAQVPGGPSTQGPGSLPWSAAQALPWKASEAGPAPAPLAPPKPAQLPLTVRISADGALRISDDQGILRLRLGLPGRPLRVWRDWGIPVPDPAAPLAFPADTPARRGLGSLPLAARDFRPALEGLLWILDDDERLITLIHPATAQVAYLPLPGGQHLSLSFYPDHLETQDHPDSARDAVHWSLPWLALLPTFIQFSHGGKTGQPTGTALVPFPKE